MRKMELESLDDVIDAMKSAEHLGLAYKVKTVDEDITFVGIVRNWTIEFPEVDAE